MAKIGKLKNDLEAYIQQKLDEENNAATGKSVEDSQSVPKSSSLEKNLLQYFPLYSDAAVQVPSMEKDETEEFVTLPPIHSKLVGFEKLKEVEKLVGSEKRGLENLRVVELKGADQNSFFKGFVEDELVMAEHEDSDAVMKRLKMNISREQTSSSSYLSQIWGKEKMQREKRYLE